MVRSLVPAALAALVCSACYTYTPSTLDEVAPHQDVRLRLSRDEAGRLQEVRRSPDLILNGRVMAKDADSVKVRVEAVSEVQGMRVETLYQFLEVSRGGVVDVEVRQLDKVRTYVLAGAGAAGALAVVLGIKGNSGSDVQNTGGGPFEAVVPLFSLRVPFHMFSLLGGG